MLIGSPNWTLVQLLFSSVLCFLSGVNWVALPQETSVTQLLTPKWGYSRTRMSCGSLTAWFRLQVERHATEGEQPRVGASEERILIQHPLLFSFLLF